LIPESTKFLDTQGILSIADSIQCATTQIKYNNQEFLPSSSEGRNNHFKAKRRQEGKAKWTVKVRSKQVEKPVGAPGLPIDLLLTRKHQKIWCISYHTYKGHLIHSIK
jgi:hypothetical protein